MAESNVYIDVKPSEQLHPGTDQVICFSGIAFGSLTESIPSKLKDYKATKTSLKGFFADELFKAIETGDLKLYARSFIGNMNGTLANWSIETWNQVVSKLDVNVEESKSGKYFEYEGERFNLPLAMGLAAYTNILVNMGLDFGNIATVSNSKIDKLNFCLDNVPGASKAGMGLMEQISKLNPDLVQLWKENMADGMKFQIANLGKWMDVDGKWKHVRYNPTLKLVDWIAASCLANYYPGQILEESKNITKSDLKSIQSIWNILEERKLARAILLDDPKFITLIKEHEAKKSSEKRD